MKGLLLLTKTVIMIPHSSLTSAKVNIYLQSCARTARKCIHWSKSQSTSMFHNRYKK